MKSVEISSVDAKHGRFHVPASDAYIARSLLTYGEYCESEVGLFQKIIKPGQVVVDAGANIGAHSVVFGNMVGPTGLVYTFEPQPFLNTLLGMNMINNGHTNARCFTIGLGADSRTAKLPNLSYTSHSNYGGYSLAAEPEEKEKTYLTLPIMPLDQVIDPHALGFLKADVEFMELPLLQGAKGLINQFKPVIYLECDWPEDVAAITDFLHGYDYACYWHISPLYNPKNHFGHSEDLFGNAACINMLCVPESRVVSGLARATDAKSHPKYGQEREATRPNLTV